jgi:hypothetical protein
VEWDAVLRTWSCEEGGGEEEEDGDVLKEEGETHGSKQVEACSIVAVKSYVQRLVLRTIKYT